jgi:poly(A) polymerase
MYAMPTIVNADWLTQPCTQSVFQMLAAGGHAARAVGGAVRNSLLGVPVDDIDIATTAEPEVVMQLAAAAGLRVVGTGLAHGTVTVISAETHYEVTTLREDVATYGRHADVAFTADWRADASRRDFTINALYCEADGTLFDPLGGLADLEARRVRFIGNPHSRIKEDYLRILRFFRFFAQYGAGEPEVPDLLACIQERRGLRQLSRERIRQELVKLVCAPRTRDAVSAMHAHGLLTELLPIAPDPTTFERMIALDQEADAALRLAALCVQTGEDVERLTDHLRLTNAERRTLATYADAIRFKSLFPGVETQRVLLYRHGSTRYRQLITALCARSFTGCDAASLASARGLPDRWAAPVFPLSGADVIEAGIPSGPAVGEILGMIENEWIASGFSTGIAELRARLTLAVQSHPTPAGKKNLRPL